MRVNNLRNRCTLVVSAVFVAGLVYSSLCVVLTPKQVYATSCDCLETKADAEQNCQVNFGNSELSSYSCPWTVGGTQEAFFVCAADPQGIQRRWPCNL